jgi:hypothetical protein
MANVVGILIVLVAVSQLSVGDAVDRIAERGAGKSVSRDRVEALESSREEVEKAIVVARGKLEALDPTASRKGMLKRELEPRLDALERLAGGDPAPERGAAELEEIAEGKSASLQRLFAAVEESRERVSQLDEILSGMANDSRPRVARLPDPRPPPKDLEEIVFFCRYGRVLNLEPVQMLARLRQSIAEALGEDRPLEDEDGEWIANLLRKESFGWENFYWRFRETEPRGFFADMIWRDRDRGETALELRLGGRVFSEVIGEGSPARQYVRFWVWSDSFEAYLEARYLAESKGYEVAWSPVSEGDEVGVNLRGGAGQRVMLD